ncbi:MAG TPA: DUF1778 domain-containing protein [Thermoleophilia bacterium]|nr:DUF1778 domain-containing protein [Thermoleophilia bacterium]
MAVVKDRSLNIRVTEDEKAMVEQAAALSHMGMSQFMLQATLRAAEEVLADQTRFVLPHDKWDDFVALLDRPARVLPRLREAASKPSPFGER